MQQFSFFIGILLVGFAAFFGARYMHRKHALEHDEQSSHSQWMSLGNRFGSVLMALLVGGILFALMLRYGRKTSIDSLRGSAALLRSLVVFGAVATLGFFDRTVWHGANDRYRYFFACVLGTLSSWVIIVFKRAGFETALGQDPFMMALLLICIVIGWKFLFGPWSASIKSTVLGTFIFWIIYAFLRSKTSEELLAIAIAAFLAMIPVIAWCWLFLKYHHERFSHILLAFFAGMLSTVPILFYSELVQRGIQLNFFLFKVVPVNFGSSARDFTTQSIFQTFQGTSSTILVTLVTYLLVGVIEELSKAWVLMKSSKDFFRSIDDVLQLSIVVALGFAFAENIANPSYFVGFVHQYLLSPDRVQIGPLIGSVVGRSVLTMMVHILSTGVLGYFLGVALFATPLMREEFQRGKIHPIAQLFHRMLALRTEHIYARSKIFTGFFCAILLHGFFDFIVSISEVLPGNPSTIGQLVGSPVSSPLSSIPITLLPALLYVVGGFWLLSYLFQRKEDMKEFGQILEVEVIT